MSEPLDLTAVDLEGAWTVWSAWAFTGEGIAACPVRRSMAVTLEPSFQAASRAWFK